MLKKMLMLLGMGLALAGCSQVDVQHYRGQSPTLELREYFEGRTEAWGMFQKRSGEVVKRFHVVINGHSEGERLILDEEFTYSDGTTDKRVWTLTPQGEGRWQGTAGDVVGVAQGEVAGNAFHWRYVLRLPVDGKVYEVHMDDWMYLIDEQTLVNRTVMSKFGVELGQVTVFFRKQP